MRTLKFLLISVTALLAALACTKEPEVEPVDTEYDDAYYAELATISSENSRYSETKDGATINFRASGGEVVINVSCGTDWTVENHAEDLFDAEWSVSSGILTVTAAQNVIEEEFTATMVLKTAVMEIAFATLTITQNAYGAPEVTLDADEWHAPAVGELSTEIGVDASAEWYAESSGEDWLAAEADTAANKLTLTVLENEEIETREATVTVTTTDGIHSTYETLKVTQDGKAYIKTSSENIVTYSYEATYTVDVESNHDWTCSTAENWISLSANGDILSVTVSDNSGSDDREGTITLTAGDGAANVAEATITVTQSGPNALILTYTTTSDSETVKLPLYGTVDCTVNWGDGEEETVTGTYPTHTYAEAGEYNVKIAGTVTALYSYGFSSSSSPNTTLTAVRQWGNTGLTAMQYAFYYCYGLTSVPTDNTEAFADVTSFYMTFYHCEALEEVPAGIFDHASKVTTFYSTLGYCTSLKSVPEGIFSNCTGSTNFSYLFYYDSALETVPENLFANSPDVTTFYCAFYNCSALKSAPAGMFAQASKSTSFGYVFSGCTALESVAAGIFDTATANTTFAYAFRNCSSLKSVPEGLFANCSAVTTYTYVFYGCSALASIPEKLFADSPKVTTFAYAFSSCSSLKSVPGDIFSGCTKVTSFEDCFQNCTSLETVGEGLFDVCTAATLYTGCFFNCSSLKEVPALFAKTNGAEGFGSLFYGCTSLTTVPKDLFAGCSSLTNMFAVFSGCASLAELPEGLLDSCTAATNFSQTFMSCASLTELPDGLFAHCVSATTFSYTFSGCSKLVTIPADTFKNCVSADSFDNVFAFCVFTTVPETLFDDCVNATNFRDVFNGCAKMTSVPAGIFSNNVNVTNFYGAFLDCTGLTSESPYSVIDGEKVHLYERSNYPDYFTKPTTFSYCFWDCYNMADYATCPNSWKL